MLRSFGRTITLITLMQPCGAALIRRPGQWLTDWLNAIPIAKNCWPCVPASKTKSPHQGLKGFTVKTNGLVSGAATALVLGLASLCGAEEEVALLSEQTFVSDSDTDQPLSTCLSDELDCAGCCRRGGFWFAGTEATMLRTAVRTGGHITASFSDTTAPGVSTAAFRDGNGVDKFAFAPRLWIGRQITQHFGIVARYWDLTVVEAHRPAANPAI